MTDEFRLFSDYFRVDISSVEVYGDDGFYVNAIGYNINGSSLNKHCGDNHLTVNLNLPSQICSKEACLG